MKPKMGYSGKGRNKRVLTPTKMKKKREAEVSDFIYQMYKKETDSDKKAELLKYLRELRS